MISRRRFLGHAAIGMMTATAGCSPPGRTWLRETDDSRREYTGNLQGRPRSLENRTLILGYPINMSMPTEEFFAWRRQLQRAGIGMFAYNNVGDPFQTSPIAYNTHDYERGLILHFGDYFRFLRGDVWGFLSHSGTDSNMHGMYIGRTLLKARHGVAPKLYYTKETHYSIQILQDLLGLDAMIVDTQADGGMDPLDLERKLDACATHPALVVATIGTTFKGAIDPLDQIRGVMKNRAGYLHLDAALFGGYLAYTNHADELRHRVGSSNGTPRYESIAVSCHKFFGLPAPAGLFITTKKIFDEFRSHYEKIHDPAYIHHVPGTITCSRDAVKPAEFYFFTTDTAQQRLVSDARSILHQTSWLIDQMQLHFPHLQPVRANPLSNTVYFRRPGNTIVRKYSLATVRTGSGRDQKAYAHIVVMPHANRQVLTDFLTDLEKDSGVSD